MSKPKLTVLAAVLLCVLLLFVGPVPAMDSDNYAINWDVIGGGGGPIASTNYALDATIGQASVGLSSSTNDDLCSGFWCWAGAAYGVYLPIVLRNF